MDARLGLRLLNVLGLAMLLPALAWSGTYSVPETVVANADGSFKYIATYTAGPGETFGSSWVNNVENTNVIEPIADGFCLMALPEGVPQIIGIGGGGIAGKLLNSGLPGKVKIEYSACGGATFTAVTTILPPMVTPPPPPPTCYPIPCPPPPVGCKYVAPFPTDSNGCPTSCGTLSCVLPPTPTPSTCGNGYNVNSTPHEKPAPCATPKPRPTHKPHPGHGER